MRIFRNLSVLLFSPVGILVSILASCEHKELCYDHSHTVDVRVVLDWKNAAGANPSNMRLYLFPQDGGEVLSYGFTGCRGGNITVPTGCYKVLCLNSDTRSILYRNIGRFTDFEAYTVNDVLVRRSVSTPRADGTQEERVARSPDRLWCARADGVCLGESGRLLTLYPEEAVCRYRLEIRHVENLKYIAPDGISGALSGMSGGLFAGMGITGTEVVTVPFGIIRGDSTTLTADFLCFGCPPPPGKKHMLTVYALLADGSKFYYSYDVTSRIHAAKDPRNVPIVLDSLHLPRPITNGGGFRPSVDEWWNMNIDIPM